MIAPETIIQAACTFALVVLGVAFILTVYRVVKGPTLPDRVLALDMLVGIVIGFIAVIAIRTGYTLYIDIAISLGLVGFLATIAFARFILARGVVGERPLEDGPVLRTEKAKAKGGKRSAAAGAAAKARAAGATQGGRKK
ncbi:MAG: cation:proton antiporter [Allorhizobium sp.]